MLMEANGLVLTLAFAMVGIGLIRAIVHELDGGGAKRAKQRKGSAPSRRPARELPEGLEEVVLPALPTFNGVRDVASCNNPEQTYTVDLDARTCTCGDFQDGRGQIPVDSIGRLCKHLGGIALHDPALEGDELVQAMVSRNYGSLRFYRATLASGATVAIGCTPGNGWFDVFVRQRVDGDRRGTGTGPYKRYGYYRPERRWSYAEGPPGSMALRELLKQFP